MSDLRTRAAQATELHPISGHQAGGTDVEARAEAALPLLADVARRAIELDATIEGSTSTVPVHEAYSRVMGDVQYVAKDGQRSDSGGRYRFRGIDALLNAVGPALRKHGLVFVPSKILAKEYDQLPTGGGKVMQRCKVTVAYAVLGPAGDVLPLPIESIGEAFDTGDKAGSKAMSVALRTAYIQAFAIPVDQPEMDPERGPQYEVTTPPPPSVSEYVAMIANPTVSIIRLRQMHSEIGRHGLGGETVTDVDGGTITLGQLLGKRAAEVKAAQAEEI
jgi:hypothetical protein